MLLMGKLFALDPASSTLLGAWLPEKLKATHKTLRSGTTKRTQNKN